jgi:POT family proton-dependent oligopeptide transporter
MASSDVTDQSPLQQIVRPFIDLFRAPRVLHGLNWPYALEGMVYFGILGYLTFYFTDYVKLDDIWAGRMVGVLTMGITIAMFLMGGLVDRWGVRRALSLSFILMFIGRAVLSAAPYLGLDGGSIGSPFNLLAMAGIFVIVFGYGTYEPAAYSAVKQVTDEKGVGPAYAMLYAVMNLGGWIPSWFTGFRQQFGVSGVYVGMTAATGVALLITVLLMDRKTVDDAIAKASAARDLQAPNDSSNSKDDANGEPAPLGGGLWGYLKNHPLADLRFSYFIFCLIPVQTLFAHSWLTLPAYVNRAYADSWPWISENFEKAVNFNPLLIFIFVPIMTELTKKKNTYSLMIWGTLVMSLPAFLLAIGPTPWALVGFIVIKTVGEAIWQPRFLQYAAEIAPPGRLGAYMGVSRFPWFLTKLIVPIYSGWFLQTYCEQAPTWSFIPKGLARSWVVYHDTRTMWLIYGAIAVSSTVLLLLAKGWLAKDFKSETSR